MNAAEASAAFSLLCDLRLISDGPSRLVVFPPDLDRTRGKFDGDFSSHRSLQCECQSVLYITQTVLYT